jgi:hypothetical protein
VNFNPAAHNDRAGMANITYIEPRNLERRQGANSGPIFQNLQISMADSYYNILYELL